MVQYTDRMYDPRRIETALAANLREWRARRGWSQSELATRAGLSKGMLVQVERAQTNPSIQTLCKLANALGIALLKLVEDTDEPVVRRVTAADVAWLWRGRSKASAAGLVAGVEAPVPVELWEWRIGARDRYDAIAHPAGTREFVYVLEGEMNQVINGKAVKLGPGMVATLRPTDEVRHQLEVFADASSVEYQFAGVVPGEYIVISGTDLNNDGFICDEAEACGAYPVENSPETIVVDGAVTGIDFLVAYRTGVPTTAGSTATSKDVRPELRRRRIMR